MEAEAGIGRQVDANGMTVDVERVQPYQATKIYWCPGCNQDIPKGMGHLVVVPVEAPDLRRHWHKGCWQARNRRRPGHVR